MGGPLIGTYVRFADDIARMIAALGPGLPRVLPVIAQGGTQVIYDLVALSIGDGAVVSGVTLDVIRRAGWLPDMVGQLTYVSQLYFEEVHVVSTQLYQTIESLDGQTVNVGPAGGGTDTIARRLFEHLGVRPVFSNTPTALALQSLPTGDPAAVVFIAGKPVQVLRDISIIGNLHFIPIPMKAGQSGPFAAEFQPSVLVPDDYPRFIPFSFTIPTVASATWLIVRDYPAGSQRAHAVSSFVRAFVPKLTSLQSGAFQPKWRESNILAKLDGFRRAPEVVEWFNKDNGI
jgi:TRAP-type uncharacterized transport system substrate-binding protein